MHQSVDLKMQSLRSTQSQIGRVGGTEDLATKALLPAGVANMAMWGKTKFAFGKYEKKRQITRLSSRKIPAMSHGVEAFDQRLSEGSCLGLVKVH